MTEETTNAPEKSKPQDAVEPAAPAGDQPAQAAEAQEEAPEDKLPKNKVTVEDAGTLRKKITVDVARERIDAKFNEMFGELGRSAQVPGFRIGRAPRRLVEKRFGKEVADDVRNALVGEALGSALEDEGLNALGEPDIKLDEITLPDEGEMTFSFEVEVAPEFELPDYKGIEVKRSTIEITDEHVEQGIRNMLAPAGKLKPVDSPAAEGDVIEADVKITGEGIEQAASNIELRVAPGQIEGIPIEDLPKAVKGKKAGQSCSLKTKVPAGHPNEQWREEDVEISIEVKDVKRLELPELTDALAASVGHGSADELRALARRSMEARLETEKQQAMRAQIGKFLLDNSKFDLPEGLSARHTQRTLNRRYTELLLRGVSREEIDRNLQQLESAAAEEAAGDLKLSFILAKVAEAEGLEIDEGEVNARVAQIGRQQKRRPERVRTELANEGRLEQLAASMLEEKAIEKVLESAKVVDVGEEDEAKPAGKAKPAKARSASKPKAAKKGGTSKKGKSGGKKSGGDGEKDG